MSAIEEEVVAFVVEFTGYAEEKIKQESTLYDDLRVDGADGWDLIEAFGTKFSVDIRSFRPDEHFGPEGLPLSAPFQLLWYLISWPFKKRDDRTPEEASGLKPIRIVDLTSAAESKRWIL
jgi:acyl carrier protein